MYQIKTIPLKLLILLLTVIVIPITFNSCKGFETATQNQTKNSSSTINSNINNLQALALSGSEVELSWSLSNAEDYAFSVYRDDQYLETVLNTSYNDAGLTPNTDYTYKVYAAVKETGTGYAQGSVTVTTLKNNETPPNTPPIMSDEKAYYTETFENGTKTNANGFSWNNTNGVSNEYAYTGNYSLKFSYGPNAEGEDSSSEQRFTIAPNAMTAPTEVWIEYMLRIPDNFTHRTQSPSNNKLISVWAENYSSNGDVQAVFEYEKSNSTMSHLRVLCMSGRGCLTGDYSNHIIDTSMRGKWIRIRIHLKAGMDGAVELWRDNDKVYSIYNYQNYFNGGNNYWRKGYLMGWSNSGFSSVTNFYIDDFNIYTNNPNWSFD